VIKFDVVTKLPTTLAIMYMGEMLDTPNDLVAHQQGIDLLHQSDLRAQGRTQGVGQAIFWRDPAGMLTALALGGMPTGIALSPTRRNGST